MVEMKENATYQKFPDYEEEEETAPDHVASKGAVSGAADTVEKGYNDIHGSGFKDFLLRPELLRSGFEHPSEGSGRRTKDEALFAEAAHDEEEPVDPLSHLKANARKARINAVWEQLNCNGSSKMPSAIPKSYKAERDKPKPQRHVPEWMVSLGIAPKKPSMASSNIDNKQAFNDGLASKRQREVGTKSIEASEEAKKVAAAALAAVKDATAVNKGGKIEVDAGADLIITQLFYDTDIYLKFVNDCRQIGIKCPIVPGIMPINNYKGFLRMAGFCKTKIPSEITAALEPIKDNDEAVRAYGIHLGTEMCKKILAHGIKTLHLYTLNMEKSALGILANLGLIDMSKIRRPLPWRPATNVLRTKENVRPIFWANRPRSYISRTIGWEQFPHGRWGDTRSPAYGALNDYQFLRRRSRSKKIVEEWVVPLSSIEDIQEKFANFCSGKLKSNPWSELDGLQPETVKINEKLEQLNWKGFLTINSQPAVNGEKSDSPSIGWGGAAGYVYQKAYVEFFCSPEKLNALVERAKDLPFVTYIAVNKKGATVANIGPADVNAVTWGVFPAKEVVQPTVVDPVSFMVWKDEAFQAWEQEWASLYPDGDPSRKILEEVQSSYYLVSVVDNDYIHGDLFSVFEEL